MTAPSPPPPVDASPASPRPRGEPSAWADTAESRLFDEAGQRPPAAVAVDDAIFDVCHVGMVLRAVLFVEVVLALGVLFVAADAGDAALRLAFASALAMPALLLWLSATCLLRRRLAALGMAGQRGVSTLLGALSAGAGWALLEWAGQGLIPLAPWYASVASGAALALLLTSWLQQRNRGRLPADTRARLAELQSRIRPHFLFNTLNSALGLVRRDPQRAEALLEDLAELFRVALASDASVVTLGEEIALAERYLAIEQIRFGSRLQVVWQLDPAAAHARVPPLLLQPLVENAVRHGVEPDPAGGVIRIVSRVRHGFAWLSITNTLPAAAPGRSTAGQGIAVDNVRERLQLMHDIAARFEIEADGQKFRVQLAVPLGGSRHAGAPATATPGTPSSRPAGGVPR
ncbi:sensor histidine kinase [Piscinibacter sakaiensis]|uniref:sensor histidine kinase n=1 Tax=Piscinibacter sakaiensis TaxID=1547922 RepID=UPI003AAC251C